MPSFSAVSRTLISAASATLTPVEVDFIYSLSRIVNSLEHFEGVLTGVAEQLTQLPGIHGVQFEWRASAAIPFKFAQQFRAADPGPTPSRASAIAPIAAADQSWGTVRITFDLADIAMESPVRTARFVGQQIGLWLTRESLKQKNGKLRREIEGAAEELARRKALARGAA